MLQRTIKMVLLIKKLFLYIFPICILSDPGRIHNCMLIQKN